MEPPVAKTPQKTPRLTWRKRKSRPYTPKTHGLYRTGETDELVIIQEKGSQWFWYGLGMNTCDRPTDLDTAKAEALAYARKRLAEKAAAGEE